MITLFSWFLIPCVTVLAAGGTGYLTSNFSVTASLAPGSYLLITWAVLTGGFFHFLITRIIGHAGCLLPVGKEPRLTDLAVFLLMFSVFLPYSPEKHPGASALHVMAAFTATVLFYVVITILDLKLYFQYPDQFSFLTGLLAVAAAGTFSLLILAEFLISSALEIFLTVFASLWLDTFYRKVRHLSNKLSAKEGV